MRLRLGLMLAPLLVGDGHAAALLSATFDRTPVGDYRFDSCKAQFPGVTWNNGLSPDSNRVQVVEGGDTTWSGRSIRVFHPASCLGPGGTGGALACGAQWRASIPGMRDTLMSRYRIFFPEGFEWVKGGKLPGLCGSRCNTGGNPPSGTDGWSARLMWRASAELVMYLYYPGQSGTYGTDLVWKDSTGKTLSVQTGRWHEVVTRISLNTPGKDGAPGLADGRVQAWYDGHLAIDTTGIRFRDLDTMHVNQFYFSTFFGGNTPDFSPTRDNRIFFDDFLVADSIAPTRPASVKQGIPEMPRVRLHGRTLSWEAAPEAPVFVSTLDGHAIPSRHLPTSPGRMELPRGVVAWRVGRGPSSESGLAIVP